MRRRLVPGLLALLVSGSAGAASTGAAAPKSDPAGLALHHQVQAAYARVPAVQIVESGPTRPVPGITLRFTDILRSRKVIAERLIEVSPAGDVTVVRREGSATFVRNPAAICWHRLASSDPQSLSDVGSPFLSLKGLRVETPRKTGDGWSLNETDGKHTLTIYITKQHLVREITGAYEGQRIVERLAALKSAPTLPVPKPVC